MMSQQTSNQRYYPNETELSILVNYIHCYFSFPNRDERGNKLTKYVSSILQLQNHYWKQRNVRLWFNNNKSKYLGENNSKQNQNISNANVSNLPQNFTFGQQNSDQLKSDSGNFSSQGNSPFQNQNQNISNANVSNLPQNFTFGKKLRSSHFTKLTHHVHDFVFNNFLSINKKFKSLVISSPVYYEISKQNTDFGYKQAIEKLHKEVSDLKKKIAYG